MKEVLKILGLIALLVGLMLFVAWSQNPGSLGNLKTAFQPKPGQTSKEKLIIKTLKIGSREFEVEIADTPARRATGLSGRDSIGPNEGMLFVFENEDVRPAFWMKDMKFAIDIIWIDNEKVAQITSNAGPPKPDTRDEDIELLLPENPVDLVLEIKHSEVSSIYDIKHSEVSSISDIKHSEVSSIYDIKHSEVSSIYDIKVGDRVEVDLAN